MYLLPHETQLFPPKTRKVSEIYFHLAQLDRDGRSFFEVSDKMW